MTAPSLRFLSLPLPLFLAIAFAGCTVEKQDSAGYERLLTEFRGDPPAAPEPREKTKPLTLDESYQLLLRQSERLSLRVEDLERLEARYDQALGTALPQLTFRGSYTRQDTSGVTPSSFTFRDRTDYRFVLTQTLFDGLRSYHALRQASALQAAAAHDLAQARLILYEDAANSFFAILRLERELSTASDALRLAGERLVELRHRHELGISRRSELLAQEAEVSSLQARKERLSGALAVAQEVLLYLTGLESLPPLEDPPGLPGEPGPVEPLIARAIANRPDLRSLVEHLRAAEEGRGYARSGHGPTLDLTADYYTHRDGVSGDVNWDTILLLSFPLYDGGTTAGAVREAESQIRSARLSLQERLRSVRVDLLQACAEMKAIHSERTSRDSALASAEENYELVQAEYRGGLAANVEVLTSFHTLQQARLERDRVRYDLLRASVSLAVRGGVLPGGSP